MLFILLISNKRKEMGTIVWIIIIAIVISIKIFNDLYFFVLKSIYWKFILYFEKYEPNNIYIIKHVPIDIIIKGRDTRLVLNSPILLENTVIISIGYVLKEKILGIV